MEFFALPSETKLKIVNTSSPNPQRGSSWVREEQTSKLREDNLGGSASWDELRDVREHFDAGTPEDVEFPNKWPSGRELPGFQKPIEACYQQL
ncbi:hypothetical protein CDD81_1754 [Ophiocordyceps australis]|uniref:Non-haem dioxygenase N-terminal domain-containing protein n=1 Tax=Ophiocordyceps australis TaxID=1399860 RepID=A0A2C5XKF5_9HYPO|nr:hypothetical protein CDD81_1754 [Ophiocordyceps australis]